MADVRLEPLGDGHDLATFDCGVASLNDWLVRRARRSEATNDARTYVLPSGEAGRIAAYFCLSTASVARSAASGSRSRNAPDPIPAILIGRLAVDLAHQRAGIGTDLLIQAIKLSVAASKHVGARLILVNPINETAAVFYEERGFDSLAPEAHTMAMLVSEAEQTLREYE